MEDKVIAQYPDGIFRDPSKQIEFSKRIADDTKISNKEQSVLLQSTRKRLMKTERDIDAGQRDKRARDFEDYANLQRIIKR